MHAKLINPFLMLLFCISVAIAAPQFEIGWQMKGAEGFSGPNVIQDAAGKTLGIVVCEVGIGIVRFTASGERVWEYPMTPPVTAYPAVADINGDGAEEIVAGDAVGRVVALDQAGNLIWSASCPGSIRAKCNPVIADLDGDQQPEILIGDNSGYLSCFDARGKLRWQFIGDGTQTGPPLVADIYDSPGLEIIVPSHDQHIYALKATGEWLWDLYFPDDLFPNSQPLLADLNQDRVPELYLGGGLHHFYQINLRSGKVDLAENVLLHINDAIVATDFNGDGVEEIVFGNKGAEARCFNKNGWQWKLQIEHDNFSSTPIVFNFDADPDLEILLANDALQLLKFNGTRLLEGKLPSAVNSAPLAGDFDNDGKLDMLVAGHGMFGSNLLACLKWDVPFTANPNTWLQFGGDRAHARYQKTRFAPLPGIHLAEAKSLANFEAVEKPELLSGRNTWRFDLTNPEQKRLALLTEIRFPDGTRRYFARHTQSAAARIQIPFDVTLAGNYQIRQQLVDADQKQHLVSRDLKIDYAGLVSDQRFLENLFTEIQQALTKWKHPRIARELSQELAALKGRLHALKAGQTSEMGTLIADARRLREMVQTGLALAPDKSFFAWEFSPWAYFHPYETLPIATSRTETIERELCRDEWESIAINVTNLSVAPLEIRIEVGDLGQFPAANHLEFRRAVLLHGFRREPIADALPRLDQAQLIPVPGLHTAQLWLTVKTHGLPAGEYPFELKMKTLEAEPSEVILPVKIKVVDLALPSPQNLNFCVWSRAGRVPEYELQDQIEHGVNIHFGVAPGATCDDRGKITGKLDFAEHDAILQRLAPHGRTMFVGPQSALKGAEFLSPAWCTAFVSYLRIWVKHLKELGLDYNDWLLYPYDEPSTPYSKTLQNLVEVAKLIRQADPKILIYTDPTSGTNMESLKMLNGLIDVWCPSAELLERFADEMLPVIRPTAKEIWFYDASGTSRTLSCLGLYRWRFWYAWNMNFTGAGWWTYYYDEKTLWDGPNPAGDYYSTVYTAPGAIVTSKRWEVAREGIEDFELLHLLKDLIDRAKKKGVPAEIIQNAETVLETVPKEIQQILKLTGRRTPISVDSAPQYAQATQAVRDAQRRLRAECLKLK